MNNATKISKYNVIIDQQLEHFFHKQRVEGYDPFGLDAEILKFWGPWIKSLYLLYHRCQVHKKKNIPSHQAIYVANHSGQIPMDALMIIFSRIVEADPPVLLRTMVDYWVPQLPFIGRLVSGCGGVVGTPENFRQLIRRGESILVFPEGVKGITKTIFQRYRLKPFTKGFMRLAVESKIPIVPIALVGAEEQFFSLMDCQFLAKLLDLPAFPLTPSFPLLGLGGALPMPTKYHIIYGSPMDFSKAPADEVHIERNVKLVQNEIQSLLKWGLSRRKGIFW